MSKLFIQFYTVSDRAISVDQSITYCENGFSRVWDLANPLWMDNRRDLTEVQKDLFARQDEIYLSAWYIYQMRRALIWAEMFKDTRFIVGGPVAPLMARLKDTFPSNISINCGDLGSIFGIKPTTKMWRIELPDTNTQLKLYSYGMSDRCYWGRCTFCFTETQGQGTREWTDIDLDMLARGPKGTVFLSTPALTPSQIEMLPLLDFSNKKYMFYLRGDAITYTALEKVLPRLTHPDKLLARIGVEFPSDRMLRIMNKGVTVDELLRVINLLDGIGVWKCLFYMTGWREVIKDDILEAERFFKSLEDTEDKRTLHSANKMRYMVVDPTLDSGLYAYAELDKEAKELDDAYNRILSNRKNVQIYQGAGAYVCPSH